MERAYACCRPKLVAPAAVAAVAAVAAHLLRVAVTLTASSSCTHRFFLCIDPSALRPFDDFIADVELLKRSVKAATPKVSASAAAATAAAAVPARQHARRVENHNPPATAAAAAAAAAVGCVAVCPCTRVFKYEREQEDGGVPVSLPGEPELAIEATRRQEGIPVPGRTWYGFQKLAVKLEVELPTSLEAQAEAPLSKL